MSLGTSPAGTTRWTAALPDPTAADRPRRAPAAGRPPGRWRTPLAVLLGALVALGTAAAVAPPERSAAVVQVVERLVVPGDSGVCLPVR